MARRGPAKRIDGDAADASLRAARDFQRDARDLYDFREDDENANGVITLVVNAAIAYADAVTARYGRVLNQQDHKAAVRTLQSVLGNRADAKQLERLQRILDEKDTAAYGVRRSKRKRAGELLDQLERFSLWAEQQFRS